MGNSNTVARNSSTLYVIQIPYHLVILNDLKKYYEKFKFNLLHLNLILNNLSEYENQMLKL